jgi:chromosome segregation ATPase
METKQTSQMVAWLDEERRKDKALITKLEERAAAQAALLGDQTRRLQTLEGELEAARATTISASMFDETISRLRTELTEAIEQARQSATDQELRRAREIDREGLANAVEELRQELTARVTRELDMRRAEEERLSRIALELQDYADNLRKSFEEFERTLSFLEEQRRQDSRRLSDINSGLAEINKRLEGHQAKAELLEELSRRNERNIGEASNTLAETKQQRQSWLEQEALVGQERERMMGEVLKRMDNFADDMTAYAKQFEGWADTHRTMRKYVDDFDRLADRVDRRVNEVAEIQRLSEDRFRQEWEEFLQEDQKRWRQFTLSNEEAWRANEKITGDIQGMLANLNEQQERLSTNLRMVMTSQQEMIQLLTEHFRTVGERIDEGLKK